MTSLSKYKQKRNFKVSPEPVGGTPAKDKLHFVIQKHDASHLHYDFRLEMEGVLKSWAVPKGPSTDPEVKRLAMMVEDHPYDYKNFEGIIPSGYGAGTVIVWDEGTYEPVDVKGTKKQQDENLVKQLKSGKIKIRLYGKKLHGKYALVKSYGRGENAWLLMKLEDEFASAADITRKDKSVRSAKTLKQVESTSTEFYGAKRVKQTTTVSKKEKTINKRTAVKAASERNEAERNAPAILDSVLSKGKRAALPQKLAPMLATLVDKPFADAGWIYEIKWDGYRAVSFCKKNAVEIKSRNDKSFDEKFYPVHQALKELNLQAVLDGEIVVLNANGQADFSALQNWRSEADGELFYYVFDLLWLNGKDLMQLPLLDRRALLKEIIPENDLIRVSEYFEISGIEFFDAVKKMGLEGMIAKRGNSIYIPGNRSKDWLKIKANKRQEMVIGGYTRNEDTSKLFSALLVGHYVGKQFIYTGKIGTGFNDKTQQEMMKKFKPLITKKAPFQQMPDINKPSRFRPDPPHATATWLKPVLVCEVSFTEMTSDGIMRHPSFEGMRIDKSADEVVKEQAQKAEKIVAPEKIRSAIRTQKGEAERKTLLNPADETQVRIMKGHELKFTNLSKEFWPGEGITKRDLLNYYYQAAPFIVPYLKDRPQSLNRFPNGIKGESFYQKDVTGKAPDWIETYKYHSEADHRDKHFMVVTDEASLLYMANLGCIEMNPWSSRTAKPDHPDWCIIDLDPAENTFNQVIEAAQVTKQVLDSMKVPCYAKTSGSTGIHIYIPLGAKYTYEQSKEFARIVAKLVHLEIPKYTSIERVVKNRSGKMYIDFLQNRAQATISAPYSVRPKPGATVSMPLHWDEIKKGLKMSDFTIRNAVARFRSEGDIFKPVLGKGINLSAVVKSIS
jgi:bifunctional non-homologous end joining protein LigD